MVKYENALKKPFTDLGKLVLGIILSIIPIINWIAQGFILECSGAGKNKPSKKMPKWKGLGDLFVKGFLSYVITFIYMVPAIIVFLVTIGYAASFLMPALVGIMPEGFISSMMAGQITGEDMGLLMSQNWMLILPALTAVAPILLLGMILLLAAFYLSPIAVLNYLKNKRFGKAFDFSFVISKALTGKYLITWLIAGIITIILRSVLFYIPWIGSSIAFFISGVIAYSLFGQVFREK